MDNSILRVTQHQLQGIDSALRIERIAIASVQRFNQRQQRVEIIQRQRTNRKSVGLHWHSPYKHAFPTERRRSRRSSYHSRCVQERRGELSNRMRTGCAGVPARMGALIAVLRYVDPCPGLPCCARRPCRAECRPKFIAFLRYIDHCSYSSCRARPSLPVECRPKFISVIAWGARFRGCSTPSARFNLCENCYISVIAWGALFPGVFNLVQQVQPS